MGNPNEPTPEPEPFETYPPEVTQAVINQLEQTPPPVKSFFNSDTIKIFFSLTGGSILYCLSAASIVYGIGQIIGPTLAESILLTKTLPCLLAINLYEIALLAVLVIIVRFRNVTDDAISLLVLIALFLVTSGLTLGTLTPGSPGACVLIGFVSIALAMGKLFALRHWIRFPIGTLSLVGFGLIFVWNFLAAPLMGKPLVTGDWPDEVRRGHWMLWWLVLLAGAGCILADAIKDKTRQKETVAFIRRKSMVWVFALIILAAAAIYQYSTTYMYEIDWAWGDYLPLVVVFVMLLIELLRSMNIRNPYVLLAVSMVPLLAMVYAIADQQVLAGASFGVELLWYPPVLLAITGLAMVGLGYYHCWWGFSYVGLAYALGVILTFGWNPAKPYDLNWELFGVCMVTVLLIVGVLRQDIRLCMVAVVFLAGGLGVSEGIVTVARYCGMHVPGVMIGIVGIGMLAVCMIFGTQTHKGFIIFGAACLAISLFDYLPKDLAWQDIVALIAILIISCVVWLRTDFLFTLPVLFIPLLPKCYLIVRAMSSWGFVILSFVLLAAGGAVSFFFKHEQHQSIDSGPPTATMD
ncbi:MAG: hypothetical protein ACYTER_07340 [Planctomycetota bacterium]|jgi:hypothetical protein